MKEKFQGPTFEVQEYNFLDMEEEGSSAKFKSSSDLYARYGQDKNGPSEKDMNLYSQVRKICDKEASLVTVKDHAKNTLNLTIATHNRFAKLRLNL